jgi:hypothetical protein
MTLSREEALALLMKLHEENTPLVVVWKAPFAFLLFRGFIIHLDTACRGEQLGANILLCSSRRRLYNGF